MREYLEDAHKHRDDGYGRAQKHTKREMPKRFYKQAGFAKNDDGFAITLDGKPVKTPGKKQVSVPTERLAIALAAEWQAQGELINADTMPLVRLVNSAVESGEDVLPELLAEILKYAGGDLMLYRAGTPQELVAEQERVWGAALAELAQHFSIKFVPTTGILHQEQPGEAREALQKFLSTLSLWESISLVSITGLTGSGLLAIGHHADLFDADRVWEAAHVDEDYNAKLWGEDPEAVARRTKRRTEFDAAIKLLVLSNQD